MIATIAARLLEMIRIHGPLDDDELARHLEVQPRQSINQVARRLADQGVVRRYQGPAGKIANSLADEPKDPPPPKSIPTVAGSTEHLSEDQVKQAVAEHLRRQGFHVDIRWGRERGIDLDARASNGRRIVIEAKGEVASDQQQGNYFLGALGELVQRMSDPKATYGLALPGNRRYRGLVDRLPALAWQRLNLVVYLVHKQDGRPTVTELGPHRGMVEREEEAIPRGRP